MSAVLIRNGTLIDGTGAEPVPDAAVLIEDGIIRGVGRLAELPHRDNVEEIDAQGGYILPGLIDTHVHLMMESGDTMAQLIQPFSYTFYQAMTYMRRTVDAGVTTVRDAGGTDYGVKKAVEDGLVLGPRMQISITVLSTTGGHGDGWMPSGTTLNLFPSYPGNPSGIVDGVDAVRQRVREILRAGADIIKVCSTGGVMSPTDHPEFAQFSLEELKVMVEEAHFRRGRKVMAHAQGAEGIKNAVRAGIHSIEHGIYLDDEAIELMLEHGTYLVPTLIAPISVIEQAEATGKTPEYALRKSKETVDIHKESIAKAYKAGVKIAMGTDSGVGPHGTNLRELGLMVDIGMTPMESIVATTKVAAECMGWEDRVGTLEVGKLGDVVVTKINPLERIYDLADNEQIALVVKGGAVVKDHRAAQVPVLV
jgi:imidazolonepropionase-like amidohydrolase